MRHDSILLHRPSATKLKVPLLVALRFRIEEGGLVWRALKASKESKRPNLQGTPITFVEIMI